jgi:hypothetical protein
LIGQSLSWDNLLSQVTVLVKYLVKCLAGCLDT